MSKLTWLVAGGVGYLLGSRAGRQPYEKFAEQAQRVMQDPRVQRRADQAKRTVKRKADDLADTVMNGDDGGSAPAATPGQVP